MQSEFLRLILAAVGEPAAQVVQTQRLRYLDVIRLRVEDPSVGESEKTEELFRELSSQLRLKTQLNFKIERQEYGTLPRYQVKAQRFKDQRKVK